tara:strand:- start:507 stop:1193 length:687 start_codon:yes stop_codon:yes gene_type:complete
MLLLASAVFSLALVARPAPLGRSGCVRMQGNLFKIVDDMPGAKASALLESYKTRLENIRANGFAPNVEAWLPPRQPQIKLMAKHVREVSVAAKAAGECQTPLDAQDAVGADPEAERTARTRVSAAVASTGGTAILLASHWPDHVSIDACFCNPAKLAVGELAERAVIRRVIELAQARDASVRLVLNDERFFQLYGAEFYEPCKLYPPADYDATADAATPTVLSYRESE